MRTLAQSISIDLGFLNVWGNSNSISEENLYDTGYIIGTSIDYGPGANIKTVRDLSGKGHNVFLVLVGCTAAEIEKSTYASANAKKLIGIASGWKKCNCKEIIEIPRERFFTDNSEHSVASFDVGRLKSCQELAQLYQTLEKSKKSSTDDGKIGALIFFPSIPGSGKSSLCECLKPHQLTDGSEYYEKLKDRDIVVKEGDNTMGKYYPLVTREKCMKPSSIYVSSISSIHESWVFPTFSSSYFVKLGSKCWSIVSY